MIGNRTRDLLSIYRVQSVCFPDLGYFFSQLRDSVSDWLLHCHSLPKCSNYILRHGSSEVPSNARNRLLQIFHVSVDEWHVDSSVYITTQVVVLCVPNHADNEISGIFLRVIWIAAMLASLKHSAETSTGSAP